MRIQIIGFGAALAGVVGLAAAAHAADRNLNWGGGPSLSVSVPGRVTITQGPTARIIVSGPKDTVDRVYLDGDRLRFERSWFNWLGWDRHRGLRVDIVAPHLDTLSVHSGSNVRLSGLTGSSLKVSVHSGADLIGDARVSSMSAKVHSGADLRLQGRADVVDLAVHSGGDADLTGMAIEHASVRAHSGADATLSPRLSIKADAHSGADIRLLQRPASVQTTTHSGGDVRIPQG